MSSPLVSFVVLTHSSNSTDQSSTSSGIPHSDGEYLDAAINSILSQTVQRAAYEIVLVDNGSDQPVRPLTSWEVNRLVRFNVNVPMIYAFNVGIDRAARGQWFVPMPADDTLDPRFLEAMLAARDERLRSQVPCSMVIQSPEPLGPGILTHNYLGWYMLTEREWWREMGRFREPSALQGIADWEWWVRCYTRYPDPLAAPFAYVREELYHHRDRPGGFSKWPSTYFERMQADLWALYGIDGGEL